MSLNSPAEDWYDIWNNNIYDKFDIKKILHKENDIYDKFGCTSAWKKAWKINRVLIIHITVLIMSNPLRTHNSSREIYKSSIALSLSYNDLFWSILSYHHLWIITDFNADAITQLHPAEVAEELNNLCMKRASSPLFVKITCYVMSGISWA